MGPGFRRDDGFSTHPRRSRESGNLAPPLLPSKMLDPRFPRDDEDAAAECHSAEPAKLRTAQRASLPLNASVHYHFKASLTVFLHIGAGLRQPQPSGSTGVRKTRLQASFSEANQ